MMPQAGHLDGRESVRVKVHQAIEIIFLQNCSRCRGFDKVRELDSLAAIQLTSLFHAERSTQPDERMRTSHVLGYLIAFRIVNALLCTTFFQPDEFFQSLEVAHRLVFGYGWQTWEWRPETALRSPLHALLFVPGYWLVKVLGLEHTDAIVSILSCSQYPITFLVHEC